MIVWAFCAVAAGKSATIVYINGAKYYIHTVQAGETLYGLSKTYGVGEKVILENNPSIARGLKTAENIKIPFVADVPEPKSDKKLRKTFDFHFVSKGETLYAISRQYEIPVKTLLEDNPNLDPLHMRLGERILIRRKQIGSEDEAGTKEQWEEYRQSLNSVAEEGTAYHIVHPGETFYSLSRRFGITEAEFSALNGGLKPADLKAGAMVKIPAPEAGQIPEGADSLQRQDSVPETGQQVVQIDFRALRAGDPLDVALLLPLATGGEPNGNYLEFYQGFLLGLDSVKLKYGRSVNVDLYNTARDTARIREIVESDAFRKADLIVGPVYEEGLYPVIRFAEEKKIPVVSPLANIEGMNSDVLFQLAPDPSRKYEKAGDLVNGDKRVTLICTESADKEFEREMLALLGDSEYRRYTYKYEHPTARPADSPRPHAAAGEYGRQRFHHPLRQRGGHRPHSRGSGLGRYEPYEPRPHGAPLRGAGQHPLEPLQHRRPRDVLQEPRDLLLDLPRQTRLGDRAGVRRRLHPFVRRAAEPLFLPGLRHGDDLRPGHVRRHRVRPRRPPLHAVADDLSVRAERRPREPRQPQLDAGQLQQRLHHNHRMTEPWQL